MNKKIKTDGVSFVPGPGYWKCVKGMKVHKCQVCGVSIPKGVCSYSANFPPGMWHMIPKEFTNVILIKRLCEICFPIEMKRGENSSEWEE